MDHLLKLAGPDLAESIDTAVGLLTVIAVCEVLRLCSALVMPFVIEWRGRRYGGAMLNRMRLIHDRAATEKDDDA